MVLVSGWTMGDDTGEPLLSAIGADSIFSGCTCSSMVLVSGWTVGDNTGEPLLSAMGTGSIFSSWTCVSMVLVSGWTMGDDTGEPLLSAMGAYFASLTSSFFIIRSRIYFIKRCTILQELSKPRIKSRKAVRKYCLIRCIATLLTVLGQESPVF